MIQNVKHVINAQVTDGRQEMAAEFFVYAANERNAMFKLEDLIDNVSYEIVGETSVSKVDFNNVTTVNEIELYCGNNVACILRHFTNFDDAFSMATALNIINEDITAAEWNEKRYDIMDKMAALIDADMKRSNNINYLNMSVTDPHQFKYARVQPVSSQQTAKKAAPVNNKNVVDHEPIIAEELPVKKSEKKNFDCYIASFGVSGTMCYLPWRKKGDEIMSQSKYDTRYNVQGANDLAELMINIENAVRKNSDYHFTVYCSKYMYQAINCEYYHKWVDNCVLFNGKVLSSDEMECWRQFVAIAPNLMFKKNLTFKIIKSDMYNRLKKIHG